jgi:lipopolysaccharide export system protein LptA
MVTEAGDEDGCKIISSPHWSYPKVDNNEAKQLMMMRNLFFRSMILVVIILGIFMPGGKAFGQAKAKIRIIHADDLRGLKSGGEELNILVGDVQFEHDGAYLYCDSAVLNSRNSDLYSYGSVHIKMSDTLSLYGDTLHYNGITRVAVMSGNVILQDNQATLYTNKLTYNRKTRTAYYTTGGRIENKDNELSSSYGIYYTDTKQVHFKNNVQLVNDEYLLLSDTLIYNTATAIAFISGPTTITGKEEFLYAEDGFYDTRTDITMLRQNAYMTYQEQYLRGDSIYFEKATGIGEVFGNVFLRDTVQKVIITGNYADYHRNQGYAWATDSAMAIMADATDSLFLHADTLWLTFDTANNPQQLTAYHHSRFYKTDLQGMSDSLVYSFTDSTIHMFYDPILWADENQLTADEIIIYSSGQRADSMQMAGSAFIVSKDKYGEGNFNQIKGKEMMAYFENNELNLVKVDGNSETIYFVREEDGALIGINKAVAGRMEIFIVDRQIDGIIYFENPDATLYPEGELPIDQFFLRDFRWNENMRPMNREDIFRWPK